MFRLPIPPPPHHRVPWRFTVWKTEKPHAIKRNKMQSLERLPKNFTSFGSRTLRAAISGDGHRDLAKVEGFDGYMVKPPKDYRELFDLVELARSRRPES